MTSNVETPSGKSAAGENFPVGSWFIRRRLRPHVARFYAFARAIDDIADNPDLAPGDKIARLDARAMRAIAGSSRRTGSAKAWPRPALRRGTVTISSPPSSRTR